MRPQDIKIGESYRHRNTPNQYWATVKKVLRPKQHPNTHTYTILECEWAQDKNDSFGLIKYFRPCDLIK